MSQTPSEALREMGAEFHHAAGKCKEALRAMESARLDRLAFLRHRLAFLRQCSKDSTARLATLKEELRTLPEQIAKWDAEAARLESQTAEDLLRQALEPVRQEQPQPELYRPGLPPERLRRVWAEWEDEEGDVVTFKDEHYHWSNWRASMPVKRIHDFAWIGLKLKPLGRSWAEVEAMVDEAEKPAEPKMLDLTKLPPGTEVQLMESCNTSGGYRLALGQKVKIAGVGITENDGSAWVIPALVPARVVKEGGEDAPR